MVARKRGRPRKPKRNPKRPRRKRSKHGNRLAVDWWGEIALDEVKIIQMLGEMGIEEVRKQNAEGQGGDGPLPEYTEDYKRRLRKMGQSTQPDTRKSGELLDTMRILSAKTTKKGIEVKVAASKKKGKIGAILFYRGRNWIGLAEERMARILQQLMDEGVLSEDQTYGPREHPWGSAKPTE